ncbi:hypothetical protein THASP1DRAFT_27604 [Thamnocephalis sphaerospora]|uniref:PH domain-containing protein n=1 Tax=Thamnocephalis sphaerospora TaxID=78915 RepID=A0A4P9XN21_9FUNG|nr:hypothetical protein THASP1DRAFT_31396 [Thamnocephalis sphaerospora]RKP10591.1 hypothetical protein THASP1DRAFT_27604 [Thamnocephalis sphaerospora]|eukprot:RKP06791.1 hypothetical protein THASP1DRAFT_31396 [Thamnocephalis sphaerospora]
MACDLTDPAIQETYQAIIAGEPTNWMLLGYRETRDIIYHYCSGEGGLDELRDNLTDEVLYGLVRIGSHNLLITYMNDQVSGVRRARALVHGRAVASKLEASMRNRALTSAIHAPTTQRHDIQISASSKGELSEASIRSRFRQLGGDGAAPAAAAAAAAAEPASAPKAASPPTSHPRAPAAQPAAEAAPAAAPAVEKPAAPATSPPTSSHSTTAASPPASRSPPVSQSKLQAEKDAEAARREESERQRREQLQKKMQQAGKDGQLSGFITVQGGGCYFWKRRFFTIKGKSMFLYRDETDKLPIASLEMAGAVNSVEDAQAEVLIPNSFRVEFKNAAEPFYFFSDSKEQKDAAMQGILKCA